MRALFVSLVLLGTVGAGCFGGGDLKAEPTATMFTSAAVGRDAAHAAAEARATGAVLIEVWGSELVAGRPLPAHVVKDPFYAYMADAADGAYVSPDEADPNPGDGLVEHWQWTFRMPQGGFYEVVTQADRVETSREKASIPDDPGDPVPDDALFDNTRLLGALPASWSQGNYSGEGPRWVLNAEDDVIPEGPKWFVLGKEGGDGRAIIYIMDGRTGTLDHVLPREAASAGGGLLLDRCTNYGGVFPVAMDAARAALPADFEPIPSPNDPAGGATLYVLFLQCADSAVDGNATGPVLVAYTELAVVPPEVLRLPGITEYTVPLAMGASVDAVASRLNHYRLGIAGRSTTTDVLDSGLNGRTLRMAFAGVSLEIDIVHVQRDTTLTNGDFALIGVQDGVARTLIQAHSGGGVAGDAAAFMQSEGLPLLEQARPANRAFSVEGFTLSFGLAKTVA